MYTHCPECRASFRVTADVLQQAAGRVRCGGCGHAFNALERLSEAPSAGSDGRPRGGGSGTLLDDFDALSETDNVRIEDTGVEWQVVEEREPANPGSQESLYLVTEQEPEEERYDDNTPLPEMLDDDEEPQPPEPPRRRAEDLLEPRPPEFDERQVDLALSEPEDWTDLLDEVGSPAALKGEAADDATPLDTQQDEDTHTALEVIEAETGEHPSPEAETGAHPALEATGAETGEHASLEAIEAETGEHLTLEAGDAATGEHLALEADDAETSEHPALEVDDAETGEHLALEADDTESEHLALQADDTETDEPAPLEQLDAGEHAAAGALDADEPPIGAGDAARELTLVEDDRAAPATGDGEHYVPPATEEEMTINRMIDQDLLRLSEKQRDLAATSSGMEAAGEEAPPHFETIIMEGDFVRSSLETSDPEAVESARPARGDTSRDVVELKDTYARTRRSERAARRPDGADTRRYAAAAGIAALALLLGAQVVHAYRETLATYGAFGESLVSLYGAAGVPITPEWDIDGWQFQDTRGSTEADDHVLTISSTLVNASEHALPYPLLHVALTDRYEEIVGSQLLEAGRYLEIRVAGGRVAPGGKLNARVTIAPLPPQAEGYKLNVCYPLTAGKVRCAMAAFR